MLTPAAMAGLKIENKHYVTGAQEGGKQASSLQSEELLVLIMQTVTVVAHS